MEIIAPPHLLALVNHLKGSVLISRPLPHLDQSSRASPDLKEVRGQESAKRALEIAAAGGHHMLMIGPPARGGEINAKPPASQPPSAPLAPGTFPRSQEPKQCRD